MKHTLVSMSLALSLAACSSGSSAPGSGADDAGPEDGSTGSQEAAAGDDGGAGTGGGSITGTYGTQPIAPIVAAFWIGKPDNPAESGGGPYVYLFSGPVTCADLSKGTGWVAGLPAGTQVLELIVGTTTTGAPVQAAAHAAPGAAEINYATAPSTTESRATSGTVTLTAYAPMASVDGTVTAMFPQGSAQGTFHAVYCATGHEF
jgi:hypothetical protein